MRSGISLFLLAALLVRSVAGEDPGGPTAIEPGGEVVDAEGVVNTNGALYRDGATWSTEPGYGHEYPTDAAGARLHEHLRHDVDPDGASLGRVPGLPADCEVVKSVESFADGDYWSEEIVCAYGLRYDVSIPSAGCRLFLRSRPRKDVLSRAHLEAFIEDPGGAGVTALTHWITLGTGDYPIDDVPWFGPFTPLFGLTTKGARYWLDVDGGADRGGHTIGLETATEDQPPSGIPYAYASEFRVMYPDAGGVIRDLRFRPNLVRTDHYPNVQTQLVVTKLAVRANAAKPERSRLVASGYTVEDPFHPVVLRVGEMEFDLTGAEEQGRAIVCRDEGLLLRLEPPRLRNWSSRWTFKLDVSGPEVADIDPEGELEVALECSNFQGMSRVALARGKFKLGKRGGAFSHPRILLRSAKAVIRKGGRDSFALKFGFAADGGIPAAAPAVTVLVGMHYAETVPSSSFSRQGDKLRFRGSKQGVTSVVVDYARGLVTVKGKGVDLDMDEYGHPGRSLDGERVILGIAIGETRYSSMPMWNHAGRKLSY